MTEFRDLRRAADLSQREFADLLGVPVNTLRMWDSGLGPVPAAAAARAEHAISAQARRHEPLLLAVLARTCQIHVRTLQAADRAGRLATTFSTRSVFGRPIRFSTLAAVDAFVVTHYRRFAGQAPCPPPLTDVPDDYDERLRGLRQRLGLSQTQMATRIAAAGKAVVYQWESRRRIPEGAE